MNREQRRDTETLRRLLEQALAELEQEAARIAERTAQRTGAPRLARPQLRLIMGGRAK